MPRWEPPEIFEGENDFEEIRENSRQCFPFGCFPRRECFPFLSCFPHR